MRYIENPPNPWLTHSIDWLGEPPAAKIEIFEETETRSIISSNDSPTSLSTIPSIAIAGARTVALLFQPANA